MAAEATPNMLYTVKAPLGSGAFGQVFKAKDKKNNRIVAIKKIPNAKYNEKEITLLEQCDSKYVVKLFNKHKDNTHHWIVLEFCSGGSIEDKAGKMNEVEAKKMAYAVLKGLEYLHSKQIIHRDLKPANIFIDSSGTYKLGDFGLGKNVELSSAKTGCGSLVFMAPEMVNGDGKSYGYKVDIWALGVTIYNLITGKYPYPTNNYLQLVMKISNGTTAKLEKYGQDICDIVNNKCLQKNYNVRNSAKQLLKHSWFDSAPTIPQETLEKILKKIEETDIDGAMLRRSNKVNLAKLFG